MHDVLFVEAIRWVGELVLTIVEWEVLSLMNAWLTNCLRLQLAATLHITLTFDINVHDVLGV